MSVPDIRSQIIACANMIARDWVKKQTENIDTVFYLYYREAKPNEVMAAPVVATERPGLGWKIAAPERFQIGWSLEKAQTWIFNVMHRLPIFNPDDI